MEEATNLRPDPADDFSIDEILEADPSWRVLRTEAQESRQDPEHSTAPPILSLRELDALPEMREIPKVVVPRMALEGRVTLFCSPEKAGKSTIAGEAVAMLSTGQVFLGRPCVQGKVLWLAYDEPMEDAVRRLVGLKANVDKVYLTDYRLSWNELQDTIEQVKPDLLIVDTLTEYAVGEIDDLNSARQWTPVLAKLRQQCKDSRMGAILLHHFTKAGRGYADSRAIGAGVDIILEMFPGHDDERIRFVKFRGRGIGHGSFKLRFANGRYLMEKSEW